MDGEAAGQLNAGRAFSQAIQGDARSQAGLAAARVALNAAGQILRLYPSPVKLEDGILDQLSAAFRDACRAAGEELAANHFSPPSTIEEWEQLARIVEVPIEIIRGGTLTLGEIHSMALAWAERQRVLHRLAEDAAHAKPSHSEDFTSVNWFGVRYTFTKGRQAQIIAVLWEAWEAGGHGLSHESIALKIGFDCQRLELAKVFRRPRPGGGYDPHPAWGVMIKPDGKGCFRLVEKTLRDPRESANAPQFGPEDLAHNSSVREYGYGASAHAEDVG